MDMKELWEKDKTMFDDFDFDKWNRYYRALNKETPVEKVSEAPFYVELTDNEKLCYQHELDSLKEDRKTFPQAAYEVRLRDFD